MTGLEQLAAAAEAYDLYKTVDEHGWIDKLVAALRRRHNLLLVGPTGTGKSSLLAALKSDSTELIDLLQRTVAVDRQRISIRKSPLVFRDTPGDLLKQRQRRNGYEAHRGSGRRAVISVTSYGFHEYPEGRAHGLTSKGKPSKRYLDRHRLLELEMMKEWSTFLDPNREKFLLVAVAKADLWWSKRDEVIAYYTNGTYGEMARTLGWSQVTVIPHCSVIHRFYGSGQVDRHFDETDRRRLRSVLFETLLQLVAAEP